MSQAGESEREPAYHVIFRWTRRVDGTLIESHTVPDEPGPLDADAVEAWFGRQPTSIDRLAVAVLVIRETLDSRGLISQCTVERRRGSADGQYDGDLVRVDFTGAVGTVRLYRALPDGRLTEVAASADTPPPRVRPPEHFAAEQKALRARFGDTVRILDAREPTLFEGLVGLSGIVHVRAPDGREVGCGIGWHGALPFVLEADFPRFAATPELPEEDSAAVDVAVVAHDLVRGGARSDEKGIAILGRRRGAAELFLLRPAAGEVNVEAYVPGRDAAGPDQQRWMHYAESFEGLSVLDAWSDGSSGDIIVLSGDASGEVWRHHIDADGVETWRKSEADAAIGALHREQLFPGTLGSEVVAPSQVADAASAPPGGLADPGFAAVPSAAFDIAEAAQCLALHRPTAAVFHCTRAVEQGIARLASGAGLDDPVASGERNWDTIIHRLENAGGGLASLVEVRRQWRGLQLVPAHQYTGEEAAQIYGAVAAFLRGLA